MKKLEKKKAVIYLRAATTAQLEANNGLGEQRKICLEYAAKNDYVIVDTYIDSGVNGISTDICSAWEEMMNRLRIDPDIHAVIVGDISRISRNLALYLKRKEDLGSFGKKLISASEPFTEEGSPTAELMGAIMASFAEFQKGRQKETIPHCCTCMCFSQDNYDEA